MPVSISGTTGYAGPLGPITVDTAAIINNAVTTAKIADTNVTLAKLARVGTSGQVLTSNGTGADPSYQAIPASVTSAVAGNGIAVSAATGAVTISAAAPTFNTVGSYANANLVASSISSGSTYSAGANLLSTDYFNYQTTNNLSGTWRWMGGNQSGISQAVGVFVRTV
jgi:hypothetical protein